MAARHGCGRLEQRARSDNRTCVAPRRRHPAHRQQPAACRRRVVLKGVPMHTTLTARLARLAVVGVSARARQQFAPTSVASTGQPPRGSRS